MKTNDKDIEEKSRNWIYVIGRRMSYSQNEMASAYKAGFKACEAKMLAGASGWNEWWRKMYSEICQQTDYPDTVLANSVMEATEKAFTAGAMSQAKKDAERIKRLENALNVAANQLEGVALAFKKHGTNLNADFFIEHSNQSAEKAREALKQGGER